MDAEHLPCEPLLPERWVHVSAAAQVLSCRWLAASRGVMQVLQLHCYAHVLFEPVYEHKAYESTSGQQLPAQGDNMKGSCFLGKCSVSSLIIQIDIYSLHNGKKRHAHQHTGTNDQGCKPSGQDRITCCDRPEGRCRVMVGVAARAAISASASAATAAASSGGRSEVLA